MIINIINIIVLKSVLRKYNTYLLLNFAISTLNEYSIGNMPANIYVYLWHYYYIYIIFYIYVWPK